jgi:hypothetical protein
LTANFDTIVAANKVVYVDSAVITPGNGSCWFKAFKKLEDGLAAGGNNEVWVATGTYSPSTTAPFSPVSYSKIYGGFSAVEVTRDERNFVANRTVLDAGANANTTIEMNSLQKTLVDGFILTGAKVNGYNIQVSDIQDSLYFVNCIINNKNVDADGGINLMGDARSKVVLFLNCICTNIKAKQSDPINVRYITGTFINSIIYNNTNNSSGGVSGGLNVSNGGLANVIHSAFINNVIELPGDTSFPNAIYKSNSPTIKSTLKIYNSVIWNDSAHSTNTNSKFLVNLIDSLANDEVEYSILDTAKVRIKRFKSNGTTWEFNQYVAPNYEPLDQPGGVLDEKWFTSDCGLIYSIDKPGVNDGMTGYVNYGWLQWDIRGTGFVRNNITPDIGPYEKQ